MNFSIFTNSRLVFLILGCLALLQTTQADSSTTSGNLRRTTTTTITVPAFPLVNDCRFCHFSSSCVPSTFDDALFECQGCAPGYDGNGVICIPRDECFLDQPCFPDDQGGFCEDRSPDQGLFFCGCRNGYKATRFNPEMDNQASECTDENECELGTDDCNADVGICVNTPGSFQCLCPDNFDGDGRTCTERAEEINIPPCEARNCDPDTSFCLLENDAQGNDVALCLCLEGFFQIGRGAACLDRNECDPRTTNNGGCDANAQCINQPGGFFCLCDSGFVGNGIECRDADECLNGNSDCAETEQCVNTVGSFFCQAFPSAAPSMAPSLVPSNGPTRTPPRVTNVARSWTQLGQTIFGDEEEDFEFGEHVAISANGLTFAVSAEKAENDEGQEFGSVTVYDFVGGMWIQRGQVVFGITLFGEFGESLAMSADGNIFVATADCDRRCSGSGLAQVYRWDSMALMWEAVGFPVGSVDEAGNWGDDVEISSDGNVIIVGGQSQDEAVVFSFDAVEGQFTRDEIILAPVFDGSDAPEQRFGHSVAMSADGNTVAIGALDGLNAESVGTGYVVVYSRASSSDPFVQVGSSVFGEANDDDFGRSVDLSSDGTVLVVGADCAGDQRQGLAYVYRFDGGQWSQIGQTLSGDGFRDQFGEDVSINAAGAIVAIGSIGDDGAVNIYRLTGSTWTRLGAEIEGQREDTNTEFGRAVALSSSGLILATGAEFGVIPGTTIASGKAQVFRFA